MSVIHDMTNEEFLKVITECVERRDKMYDDLVAYSNELDNKKESITIGESIKYRNMIKEIYNENDAIIYTLSQVPGAYEDSIQNLRDFGNKLEMVTRVKHS